MGRLQTNHDRAAQIQLQDPGQFARKQTQTALQEVKKFVRALAETEALGRRTACDRASSIAGQGTRHARCCAGSRLYVSDDICSNKAAYEKLMDQPFRLCTRRNEHSCVTRQEKRKQKQQKYVAHLLFVALLVLLGYTADRRA